MESERAIESVLLRMMGSLALGCAKDCATNLKAKRDEGFDSSHMTKYDDCIERTIWAYTRVVDTIAIDPDPQAKADIQKNTAPDWKKRFSENIAECLKQAHYPDTEHVIPQITEYMDTCFAQAQKNRGRAEGASDCWSIVETSLRAQRMIELSSIEDEDLPYFSARLAERMPRSIKLVKPSAPPSQIVATPGYNDGIPNLPDGSDNPLGKRL